MPLIRISSIVGILLILALIPLSVCANAGVSKPGDGALKLGQSPENNNTADNAYLYENPRRGYFIAIPANVSLQDRGDKRGIILKSRKGYQITVQTNPTNSELDLLDMLFRLESRYLGEGRPWSRKFKQNFLRVAGLNAIEAMYEGAGTRVRVIIARGRVLDYVFIFLTAPTNFNKLVAEFDWLMNNFRPAPDDLVKDKSPASNVVVQSNQATGNVFDASELGFSFRYPSDWIAERSGKHVVIVSGKPGSPEYFATVSMQNIRKPDGAADSGQAVSAALSGLRKQILSADSNARFSGEGPYVYSKSGVNMHGGQFVVSYKQGKVGYRQWSIVIVRPNEDVIHYWSYAAPVELFSTFGNTARSILKSWTIN